ncbi:MAG: HEAT repeat domain-containing protein [Acidobacteriaceae bacterium]|nr:HEAT repeat domain-containing protein [Acidobacteriaceae bacterium]
MQVRPDRVLAQRLELVMIANTEAVETQQIRTAAQFFGALAAPDPATRLTVVKAIQRQPAAALRFGLFEGRDVIDTLLLHSTRVEGTLEWMDWIGALAGFRDGRVAGFFLDVLRSYDEPVVVFAAMQYLAADSSRPRAAVLVPLLLQNDCPVRARAAAELLTHAERLSPESRVRVGLLSSEAEPVALDRETASAWMAELHGPFRAEARADLEAQPLPAWLQLSRSWSKLDSNDQIWLLEWGRRDFPDSIGPVLEAALGSTSTPLLKAALDTLSHGAIAELHPSLLRLAAPALGHSDPQIRCAAVTANPPGVDWRCMLATEEDASVRRACLIALRKGEGEKALAELLDSLRDQDWRTRAVAAAELVRLGTPTIHVVRPLVHDSQDYVRIAAAGILAELEDFAWLEQLLA